MELYLSALETSAEGQPKAEGVIDKVPRRSTVPARPISLYLDDYIDVNHAQSRGLPPESAKKVARWIDGQIRLVMAAIRNVGDKAEGMGIASCTLGQLATRVAGVEVSPPCCCRTPRLRHDATLCAAGPNSDWPVTVPLFFFLSRS